MFKIIYLPEAEYIVDGNSSWNNPIILTFYTIEEGKACLKTMYFKQVKNPEYLVDHYTNSDKQSSGPKSVYCASDTDQCGSSTTLISKHLLEIVEVPDV